MKLESMKVTGEEGSAFTVKPGDFWPLPYRGSQFTLSRVENRIKVSWFYEDVMLNADPYPADLANAVRKVKGGHGSFRITCHGAVIAKVRLAEGQWEPRYVGRYDNDLKFKEIDNDPQDLERGMYWPGIPFNCGETWFVSPLPSARSHLGWKRSGGLRFRSTEAFPKLCQEYLATRPRGGRLYLNENGQIWMNLPDAERALPCRRDFETKQRRQVDAWNAAGNIVNMRLVELRIRKATGAGTTSMNRPVYLGHMDDFDDDLPWTEFQGPQPFGQGDEDQADDEGRSW